MTSKKKQDKIEEFRSYSSGSLYGRTVRVCGNQIEDEVYIPSDYVTGEELIETLQQYTEKYGSLNLVHKKDYDGDDSVYARFWRELTDVEHKEVEKLRAKALIDEQRALENRRLQYERLKKEFGEK